MITNLKPRFTAEPYCYQWQTRETAEYWYVYDSVNQCNAVGTGSFATQALAQAAANGLNGRTC